MNAYLAKFFCDNHEKKNSNQDMSVALWKEIATSTHRFNRRNIEMAASPVIYAFTSLKVNEQNGNVFICS
ncbi:hypothetical protein Hanom_Chr03g00182911 [Helianthus anomalus]